MSDHKIYFENSRGVKVTQNAFTTRYKDEPLLADQSVRIGREPLLLGAISGVGHILFCFQFGDLLYISEMMFIMLMGAFILVAGYSIAALRIGQYMHERTVLWESIWTVQNVRMAIAKARQDAKLESGSRIVDVGIVT